MKKKIFIYSTIFLIVVSLFTYIAICGTQPKSAPTEETMTPVSEASLVYVSIGDSIAEGYALSTYDSKDIGGFVPGSYAYTVKYYLKSKTDKLSAINYATAGLTSTNLLSMLTSIEGEDLSNEDQQRKNYIENANIITICIGANDILGPAQSHLSDFALSGQDITPYLDEGLQTLSTNFPLLVAKLQTINPTAKLVFSNVYNPYKEFISSSQNVTLSVPGIYNHNLTSAQLNTFGNIAESYIDSGNLYDTEGNVYKTVENGINQIIENTIKDQDNCYLLDVKDSFDQYYATNQKYDVIQTTFLSKSIITLPLISMQETLLNYLDPHPTELGHQQIATLLTSLANQLINVE